MFTPRHVKHSRLLLRHARKYLRYKNDLLSSSDREEIVAGIENLRDALHRRDHERVHSTADALDKTLHRLTPVNWESHWRENCEVILVAIVVAVGIRSYFLQPFKIPTGSMQPTLNGIIGHPMTSEPTNILDIGDQTQFYIKRLAGLPGDKLRIEPPRLYVDGKVAEGFGFQRVMQARDGYRGYGPGHLALSDPVRAFEVPRHTYFAMGDNSYNSFDSRWWGPVPERNLVGRGLFVYWPFIPHWGLIR